MIFSPRTPRAARALGLLVLIVAFAAGAIAATAVDQVLHAEQGGSAASTDAAACEQRRVRLLDQVGLTDEQRVTVEAILARRRAQTDRFWDDAGPTLHAIMDSTRAEIREVLTPAQRERYEELRRERKAAKEADQKETEATT